MLVGFTATRKGLEARQAEALRRAFEWLRASRFSQFKVRNGCAVGGDSQCTALLEPDQLIGHPAGIADAYHRDCDISAIQRCGVVMPAKAPLSRNGDIVRGTRVLFGCPAEQSEQPRGGTWSTIRLARKLKKPCVLFMPAGEVVLDVPDAPVPFTFGELEALTASASFSCV